MGALEAVQSLRYRFGKDHLDASTPLMTALLLGNYEIAMLLVREGARLDLRNSRKCSAADLAQGAPQLLQEVLQGDSLCTVKCDRSAPQALKTWARVCTKPDRDKKN